VHLAVEISCGKIKQHKHRTAPHWVDGDVLRNQNTTMTASGQYPAHDYECGHVIAVISWLAGMLYPTPRRRMSVRSGHNLL
jgi:hypothetical protein